MADEQEKSAGANVKGFVDDVRAEFKRISWPTRAELKSHTWIVIVFICMLGAFVFLCDQVLFRLLHMVMGQ